MHVDGEPKTVLNHTEVWGKAKLFCWNWCFAHYWLADVRTVHKKLKRFTSCWYFGLDTVTAICRNNGTGDDCVWKLLQGQSVCELSSIWAEPNHRLALVFWLHVHSFRGAKQLGAAGVDYRTWLYLGNRCTCRHETFTSTNLSSNSHTVN